MLQNIIALSLKSKKISYLIIDIIVVGFIFLIPSLSHLTSIPFYLFEPMRLALVFCIINTNQKNSVLIALTLPTVSLILSSHPEFAKSVLITAELTVNVFMFYILSQSLKNKFIVMFLSIFLAKAFYYLTKFLFLNLDLLEGSLYSTPIWIQYLLMILFSIYASIALKNKPDVNPS